jgi:hypothetical protein
MRPGGHEGAAMLGTVVQDLGEESCADSARHGSRDAGGLLQWWCRDGGRGCGGGGGISAGRGWEQWQEQPRAQAFLCPPPATPRANPAHPIPISMFLLLNLASPVPFHLSIMLPTGRDAWLPTAFTSPRQFLHDPPFAMALALSPALLSA